MLTYPDAFSRIYVKRHILENLRSIYRVAGRKAFNSKFPTGWPIGGRCPVVLWLRLLFYVDVLLDTFETVDQWSALCCST